MGLKDTISNAFDTTDVVIANGETVSSVANCGGLRLVGIITPAALTGTAITFQASPTLGGTYNTVYTIGGTAVSVTVSTSRYTALDPLLFQGIQFLKLVSGSAEGGARTLTLVLA